MGPVTIIDTPGFDDEGALGEKRVQRTRQVLNRTDVAVLVVDGRAGLQECDRQLIEPIPAEEHPLCGGVEQVGFVGKWRNVPQRPCGSAPKPERIFSL